MRNARLGALLLLLAGIAAGADAQEPGGIRPPAPAASQLPAPVLEKPRLKGRLVLLRWTASEGAVIYRCQVAEDEDFQGLIENSLTRDLRLEVVKPLDRGLYHVRIVALDGDGRASPASDPQTFRIGGGLLAWCKPCLLLPLILLLILVL
jgi:hypothetical protein